MEPESNEARRERIHLSREYQISELLLKGKIFELEKEKNRANELYMKSEEIKIKNEKIKDDIEKIKMEIENQLAINRNKK